MAVDSPPCHGDSGTLVLSGLQQYQSGQDNVQSEAGGSLLMASSWHDAPAGGVLVKSSMQSHG